jgi:hypothetical protein
MFIFKHGYFDLQYDFLKNYENVYITVFIVATCHPLFPRTHHTRAPKFITALVKHLTNLYTAVTIV